MSSSAQLNCPYRARPGQPGWTGFRTPRSAYSATAAGLPAGASRPERGAAATSQRVIIDTPAREHAARGPRFVRSGTDRPGGITRPRLAVIALNHKHRGYRRPRAFEFRLRPLGRSSVRCQQDDTWSRLSTLTAIAADICAACRHTGNVEVRHVRVRNDFTTRGPTPAPRSQPWRTSDADPCGARRLPQP